MRILMNHCDSGQLLADGSFFTSKSWQLMAGSEFVMAGD
jgi:hypothetical protein